MYAFQKFSLLALLVASAAASSAKMTTVGLENAEGSRAVSVPLDDCHTLDEEDITTVALSRPCRVFQGVGCTGRQTLLAAGEHSSEIPVVLGSIYC